MIFVGLALAAQTDPIHVNVAFFEVAIVVKTDHLWAEQVLLRFSRWLVNNRLHIFGLQKVLHEKCLLIESLPLRCHVQSQAAGLLALALFGGAWAGRLFVKTTI